MKRNTHYKCYSLPPLSDVFSPLFLMAVLSIFGFFGNLIFVIFFESFGLDIVRVLNVTFFELLSGFGIFLLYFLFWLLGYLISRKIKWKSKRSLVSIGVRFNDSIIGFVILLLVFFLYAAYKYHPAAEESFRASLTAGLYGKFFFLLISLVTIAYGIYSAKLIDQYSKIRKIRLKKLFHYLLWITTTIFFLLVLISLGGRGRAISIFIIIAAIFHYYVREIKFYEFVALTLSAIAFAIFLPTLINPNYNMSGSIFNHLWGVTEGRTFDGLYNLTKIVNWWRDNGIWGSPGQLWVGDILGDLGMSNWYSTRDAVMINVYGMEDYSAGFPATKPGELLLNFGFLGVLLGGIILGYLAGRLYIICVVRRYFGIASIPIYIAVLFKTGLASPLGYFAQNVVYALITFILAFICWAAFFGAYRLALRPRQSNFK